MRTKEESVEQKKQQNDRLRKMIWKPEDVSINNKKSYPQYLEIASIQYCIYMPCYVFKSFPQISQKRILLVFS